VYQAAAVSLVLWNHRDHFDADSATPCLHAHCILVVVVVVVVLIVAVVVVGIVVVVPSRAPCSTIAEVDHTTERSDYTLACVWYRTLQAQGKSLTLEIHIGLVATYCAVVSLEIRRATPTL